MSTPLPTEHRRFQRLEALFDLAVDTPPQERRRLFEPLRADDETLVREVEDLLAADREAAGLLSAGPWADRDETPDEKPAPTDPEALAPGDRLGPYRLSRLLSQGGMGQVFLATRDDGLFEGEVAIKVLAPGRRRSDTVLRFCLERRILARLDHPHIARLLDAGTTPSGGPFLVMEHIAGLPIDEHCEHHRLGRRPRLRLFLQLCTAVSHAHQAGLVHRDLKPSNVMVCGGSGPTEQRVKLLDFGIAKTLEPERFALTAAMTGTGERWMSLPWASPEQISGERVDPRSDVYALGVLLFDLLTAASPYGLEAPSRRSLEDAILEGWRDGVESCGAQLGDDLRAIVLEAMAHRPEDRYPDVEALARDVRRHLDHRPVDARRGGLLYRGGRFLRRHRIAAVAGVVAVALGAGWATDAVERHRRLVAERDRAIEVSETFFDLFEQPLADREFAPSLRADAMLDIGLGRLEAGLDERSSIIRARLLTAYGSAFRGLQQPDRALDLVERALAGGHENSDVDQRTLLRLALLKAQALLDLGQTEEARPLTREILAEVRRSGGDTLLAKALLAASRAELETQGPRAAEPLLDELEALLAEMPGRGLDLSDTRIDLAWIRFENSDLRAATALLDAALVGRETLLGPDHPEIAIPLQHRGWMELLRGRPREAERWLRRAWTLRSRALGEHHPLSVSSLALLTQGLERQWVDRYPELVELLARQASLEGSVLGGQHPARAETLARLANTHWHLGDAERGRAAISEALEIVASDDSGDFRRPMARLVGARIELDLGHPERAESLTLRALRELPETHPLRLDASHLLCRLHCLQGRVEEALALLDSATPIPPASPIGEPWRMALLTVEQAACRMSRGEMAPARELLRRALPPIEAEKGPENRWTRRARALLAVSERAVSERAVSERTVSERAVSERTVSERLGVPTPATRPGRTPMG